jgi:2-polyprenyl-3-methyl-5-hydroxy-6-metoxy-1,4-benzoquinol methylase
MIERNCPSCKSKKLTRDIIKCEEDITNFSMEALSEYWNNSIFDKKFFINYSRCNECRLLYCTKYFDESELSYLYQNMNENMNDVNEQERKLTQISYKKFLKKIEIKNGDYLEIGPDVGLFAKTIIEDSFPINTFHLFEPNLNIHSKLKENLNDANYRIYTNLDQLNQLKDESISLVVAIHVMDHLVDPKNLLNKIFLKMKKGGILLVVTHDESSLMAKVLKSKWPPYCMQHPQLFNLNTTKKIFEDIKFKILTQAKCKNYFTVNYLLKHILNIFNIKIKFNIINKSIGLELGNIITIAIKV